MMRTVHYKPKKCENCGAEFTPRNSRHVWCDVCLTKKCLQCGNHFHIGKKTKYDSALFCSRECKGKYRSEHYVGEKGANFRNGNRVRMFAVVCDQCGKTVHKEGVQAGKWERQFCSRGCQKLYYREHSDEVKGENSPRWKGGCSIPERTRFMQTPQYREWRREVFKRDGFTCRICKQEKSGRLNAHHIKPYAEYPDLRLDLDNGITLCNDCHRLVHQGKLEIQSEPPK